MGALSSRPWRRIRARTLRAADTCGICGGLLDKTLTAPHPLSPVVDHVLPVKLYPHLALDPTNLVAAHRRCNRNKSDRVDYSAAPAASEDW